MRRNPQRLNADQPGAGGYVDDRTYSCALHRRDRVATAQERPVEVDPVHLAPICETGVFPVVSYHPCLKACQTGIVDNHIDR